jgi:zinc transporter ZupT
MNGIAMIGLSLGAIVFLSLVHVLADMLRLKRHMPQKYWLSFADGISISYVFLGLLPKIVEGTTSFPDTMGSATSFLQDNPFLPLLIGLVTFYGMERLMEKPIEPSGSQVSQNTTGLRVWIHLASFALYKAIIGYLITQMDNPVSIFIFVVSMAVHFLVVDYRMMAIHKDAYQRIGRWVLTLAIITGWVVGVTTVISPILVTLLLAFLAGGIVLVVLEEEFSRDHPSSFVAFAAAVLLYTLVQIAI